MTRPVPILFTIPNFMTAGSGREMLNIVERLDQKRFTPSVCVMTKGGRLDDEVRRMGIPLFEAPFEVSRRPLRSLLARTRRAGAGLRHGGFRLWHSFHWSSDFTEPMVARWAGADAWIYTKKSMNWYTRAWHLRTLMATRVAARNQTMMAKYFDTPLYRRRARYTPGGVDVDRFHPDAAPSLGLRSQLGIPPASAIVTCVSQLVRVKGHPTLLQAAQRDKTFHVVLAGRTVDAPYRQDLVNLADSLGIRERVHFLEYVENVPALLAESDVFVLPTSAQDGHEEGCPVALLEAMATGRCCIATDVAGSRDLIETKHSGVLVRPDDPSHLAEALQAMILDPDTRERMGRAARQRVESNFTLEHEAAAMARLYEELVV